MGQKVNPHGLRVGIIKDWDSRWYAEKDFADNLVEDNKIRNFIKTFKYDYDYDYDDEANKENSVHIHQHIDLRNAGISRIEIERASDRVKVILHTAKPGIVIGRGGESIDLLRKALGKVTDKKLMLEVKEIRRFDVDKDAQLVAENIAQQLENRISFRRAMKSCMQRTMRSGALGIKTCCAGRLGGADMARTEFYSEGTIPLQTLRADIDYGFAEADTTYGKVGVKVWIYHGEILPAKGAKEGSDK